MVVSFTSSLQLPPHTIARSRYLDIVCPYIGKTGISVVRGYVTGVYGFDVLGLMIDLPVHRLETESCPCKIPFTA